MAVCSTLVFTKLAVSTCYFGKYHTVQTKIGVLISDAIFSSKIEKEYTYFFTISRGTTVLPR